MRYVPVNVAPSHAHPVMLSEVKHLVMLSEVKHLVMLSEMKHPVMLSEVKHLVLKKILRCAQKDVQSNEDSDVATISHSN